MGRLMALGLIRQGHQVSLYDRGDASGSHAAAHVAAAMLAPYAESVEADPGIVALGIESLKLWPSLLESLPKKVFFQQSGTLVLWHSSDRDQAVLFGRRLQGLVGTLDDKDHPKSLDRPEIAELEPQLADRFQKGFYLPSEGQLDNRALLLTLAETLEMEGVEIFWGQSASPSDFGKDWIIDCRGMGAKPSWSVLRGVRGEVVRVQTDEVSLGRPVRLLHPRYPLYIAPKPNGVFVIGATQIETEDYSPASVRSALELFSALYSVHPGFGEARILEIVSQCRPALPDNAPEIRWDGQKIVMINGLYRHGYLMAPAIMNAALELIDQLLNNPKPLEDWRKGARFPHLYSLSQAA